MDADERRIRLQIIDACVAMNASGFNQGTSGNISARYNNGLLITPSGIAYAQLVPDDIVWMSFDGSMVHPLAPSSEWRIHRDLLVARPDVEAVVHAHPPYATALAINRMEIPPVHYMIGVSGGGTVRVADYALYGTAELSANVLRAMEDRTACLMANHGLVATGPSVARALWVGEEIEALARQYSLALQVGSPVRLTEQEVAESLKKLSDYGLRPKAVRSVAGSPRED